MRRFHHAKLLTAVLVLPAAIPLHGATGELADADEIVLTAAVPVLPGPLPAFFEAHLEKFRRGATRNPFASITEPHPKVRSHYVMLDVGAIGPDERREAARRFPHDPRAALELFERHGVHGGGLPWLLESQYRDLIRAFVAENSSRIAHTAGYLLGLATDASLPFNTTLERDAGAAWKTLKPPRYTYGEDRPLRTARERLQIGLIGHLRERLGYEVRVWPGRLEPVTDPLEAIFATLLESHEAVDALIQIDKDAMGHVGEDEGSPSCTDPNAYFKAAAVRAGPILEARLKAGALLAANLIGGAWTEAGRPALHAPTKTAATPVKPRRSPSSDAAPFAGSRNSTVFHKAKCNHAARIKPENLVRFDTIEAARAAGRKPCKTCKPDAG